MLIDVFFVVVSVMGSCNRGENFSPRQRERLQEIIASDMAILERFVNNARRMRITLRAEPACSACPSSRSTAEVVRVWNV